ncbi:MAG: hypothetical protein K2P80_14480 [Beijerinckiaceae bacterium]|nr:hypothetical protein [Beijerinckiaceae bacterium]
MEGDETEFGYYENCEYWVETFRQELPVVRGGLTIDGKKVKGRFLLEALHTVGSRLYGKRWFSIRQVYLNGNYPLPAQAEASTEDLIRASRILLENLAFEKPMPASRLVAGQELPFSEAWWELAQEFANRPHSKHEDQVVHHDVVTTMAGWFASGTVSVFAMPLEGGNIIRLSASDWEVDDETLLERFRYGQISPRQIRSRDPHGDHFLFVANEQILKALSLGDQVSLRGKKYQFVCEKLTQIDQNPLIIKKQAPEIRNILNNVLREELDIPEALRTDRAVRDLISKARADGHLLPNLCPPGNKRKGRNPPLPEELHT